MGTNHFLKSSNGSTELNLIYPWLGDSMLMDDFTGKHRHCDDYIDDDSTISCLREFLGHERLPAGDKCKLEADDRFVPPELYANFEGKRVRVVMASRLGDVGLSHKLTQRYGYSKRVYLDQLTDFSDKP